MLLHVFDQHRVVDVVGVAVQLARDLLAQLALGARAQVAGVAQLGSCACAGTTASSSASRGGQAARERGEGQEASSKRIQRAGSRSISAVRGVEQDGPGRALRRDQGQVCRAAPAPWPDFAERGVDLRGARAGIAASARVTGWRRLQHVARVRLRRAARVRARAASGMPPQRRQRASGTFPASLANGRTASSVGPPRARARCRPAPCAQVSAGMSTWCTTRKRSILEHHVHRPRRCAPSTARSTGRPAAARRRRPGRGAVRRQGLARLKTANVISGPMHDVHR